MKTKILLFVSVLSFLPVCLHGRDFVSDEYNRNSLSVVVIDRDNQADILSTLVQSCGIPEKFDINFLNTKRLHIAGYSASAAPADNVVSEVQRIHLAREILSFELNRQPDGTMSDSLILSRGSYNAIDQDVINAQATKVGAAALSETGHSLVASSYLACLDFFDIRSQTDKEGKVTWYAKANAHLLVLDMENEPLEYIYNNCWIYEDDSPEMKTRKNASFENYPFAMSYVTTAQANGTGETAEEAVISAYWNAYPKLEKLVPSWQVATTIQRTRPLQAKIGTKEGLANGDRYRAYSYRENNKGEIVTVYHGYLRATEIADNSTMATGETQTSKFYQISGAANIREGWAIKQSNDLKMGFSTFYGMGGISKNSINFELDYLANITTKGGCTYLFLDAGIDLGVNNGVGSARFGVGFGYGIHFTRQVELTPTLAIGLDNLSHSDFNDSSYKSNKKNAYYLQPGARLSIHLLYPVQVFAKVGYDLILTQGDIYQFINQYYLTEESRHKSALGIAAGVRVAF